MCLIFLNPKTLEYSNDAPPFKRPIDHDMRGEEFTSLSLAAAMAPESPPLKVCPKFETHYYS